MPSLKSRIFPVSGQSHNEHIVAQAPSEGPENSLSPGGNAAPTRGIFPPEFVYDFTSNRVNPEGPTFTRGSVDVITPVRNLSLQAANAAGIKVV